MNLIRLFAVTLLFFLLIGGEIAIAFAVNPAITPATLGPESPVRIASFMHHLVPFASIAGWWGSAIVVALLAAGPPYKPD